MNEEKIWSELRGVKRVMMIKNSIELDNYLTEVINTKNRKKIWTEINGINDTIKISQNADVTDQAVRDFLRILVKVGLVDWEPRGIPIRIIDHVPSSWIDEIF